MNMLMMLLIGLKKMCCQKVFKFMDINKFGKTSYLYLTAELKDNKTLRIVLVKIFTCKKSSTRVHF